MKEEYKEIAAYEAEDYKAVVEHLAADESFKRTLTAVSHQQLHDSVNPDEIFAKIRSAGSLEQWDEVIFYPLMRWIAAHTSSGLRLTHTHTHTHTHTKLCEIEVKERELGQVKVVRVLWKLKSRKT